MAVEKYLLPEQLGGGEVAARRNPHEQGRYDVIVLGLGRVTLDGELLRALLPYEPSIGSVVLAWGGGFLSTTYAFQRGMEGWAGAYSGAEHVSWEWLNRHADHVLVVLDPGREMRSLLYRDGNNHLRREAPDTFRIVIPDADDEDELLEWELSKARASEFAAAIVTSLWRQP